MSHPLGAYLRCALGAWLRGGEKSFVSMVSYYSYYRSCYYSIHNTYCNIFNTNNNSNNTNNTNNNSNSTNNNGRASQATEHLSVPP